MAGVRVFRRAEGVRTCLQQRHDAHGDPQECRNVVGDLVFMKKARQSGEFVVQHILSRPLPMSELERVEDKTEATQFECYRRLFAYPGSIMQSGVLFETLHQLGLGWSLAFVLRSFVQAIQGCLSPLTRAELQHGDCLLNDLPQWHVSARRVCVSSRSWEVSRALDFTENKWLHLTAWVA